ncbi:hypothetical protein BAE44_0000418 [Dichanthelium oligosanthes]|uniref:KIB1-4 beta-propeller domain-containing protein n=1 Tax=Dichanthelium oligosanthes TaxID=888268 RepID=A0A1E5WME3_9POAL|nr:hypothetical protein BAE44_0000418 [Dichanthelium oligosanthes]
MRSPQDPFWMWPPSTPYPEDVIYHNGAFHFLNREENLYVCTVKAPLEEPQVRVVVRQFHPVIPGYEPWRVEDRYLVESRGELLMVVRKKSLQEPTRSSSFRVFQMTAPDADHADEYSWDELPTLDGRMLFVGHGHSRSYEVADFPELQDAVYFHDEAFNVLTMVFLGDGNMDPRVEELRRALQSLVNMVAEFAALIRNLVVDALSPAYHPDMPSINLDLLNIETVATELE